MILNDDKVKILRQWQHNEAPGGTMVIESKENGILATALYGKYQADKFITFESAASFYWLGKQ